MTTRSFVSLGVLVGAVVAGGFLPSTAVAQTGAQEPYTAPRNPYGQPDLQGFWTNQTYTPLERPDDVTKAFYTAEEVAAIRSGRAVRIRADRARYDPRRALRLHPVRVGPQPVPDGFEHSHVVDRGSGEWQAAL